VDAAFAFGLTLGLLAGVALFLYGRTRQAADAATLRVRLDETARRADACAATLAERDRQVADTRDALSAARQEAARLTAEVDAERRSGAEKLALLESATAKLREAFEALSAEALRRNNQSFLELARAALGEFQQHAVTDLEGRQKAIVESLQPVRESLARVDAQLQEVEKQRLGSYTALTEQVRSLAAAQQQLQSETGNLVRALRSPNIRGHWGELQLRRVVELAGMVAYCDFVEKESASTDEGDRRTPDLVVRMPGGRQIIVDSKAPTDAYMKAVEAQTEDERRSRLRDHARQVKSHITGLSAKAYWDQFQPTPEFVFMFLPGDALLAAALQEDPTLLEYGLGRRVIPATPLTLIALLRAVAFGWQQQEIARNAQDISDLGRQLYDRLRILGEHFESVGDSLGRSVDAYNRAVASLESRVLVTARRLKDLGVRGADELPEVATIDLAPRAPRAPELTGLFGDDTPE
jgi:DNA recombination protein RmuC